MAADPDGHSKRRHNARRFFSHPPRSLTSTEFDETDFYTASQAFPLSVPLVKVQIGSINYISKTWNDLEVEYEIDSSDIIIRSTVEGENGEPAGTYRIKGISAADLSVYCVVPSTLESMISRLLIELENDIVFHHAPGSAHHDLTAAMRRSLKTRVVKMTASVHEAGHFRDILLFLKCENIADLNPELASHKSSKPKKDDEAPKLTFLDFLPLWVLYVPWRLYSRRGRKAVEIGIYLYYAFSFIWALWQLYRHVYVIEVAFAPIVEMLKLYLHSLLVYLDWFLAVFTHIFTRYFTPLRVLYGLILVPLAPVFSFLTSSSAYTAIRSLFTVLYQIATIGWSTLWAFGALIVRPFSGIWNVILNSRVAVASLDLQRVRFKLVFTMVTGSLKSIGNGLSWLVGYTRTTTKRRKAMVQVSQDQSPAQTPDAGCTPEQRRLAHRRRSNMPVYYNSPLSKQS